MSLPQFKYHPDPIATGSIERSDLECACCGERRGYIYVGPVYSEEESAEQICPWCIANGAAHEMFDAEFTDTAAVTDEAVPEGTIDTLAFKTPGFTGWQQERWLACCGDAAAFLGRAGRAELEDKWSAAIESIRQDSGMDQSEWPEYFEALDKEGSPTAYVFKCLHCGKLLGYSDCD